MLELQRDFRPLLWRAAFFKSIGKLISFANAHQELRLCDNFVRLHSPSLRSRCESGKVDVRGDVLFAGSLIRTTADRMLPQSLYSSAMESGELFVAGSAVLN